MDVRTILLYVILMKQYINCQDVDVISDFYKSTDDVYAGMNITITGRVTQFNSVTDTILIFRANEANPYIPLATSEGLVQHANIEHLGFSNNELRLKIVNIQISDNGTYTCTATRLTSPSQSRGIGKRDFPINILNSYPPGDQPQCFILSEHLNFIFTEDDTLQVSCSSAKGQPQTVLQWSTTDSMTLPEAVIFNSDKESVILSSLTLEIDSTFDGIQFICSRQSDLFPSSDDSCSLGPFMLQDTTDTTIAPINTTFTQEDGNGQTVIVAVTLTVIIILILICVLVIAVLKKLGKCPLFISHKANKTKPTVSENVPIEMTSINEGQHAQAEVHDNPVPVEHFVANSGAEYALITKKNGPQSNEGKNKYPNPPNYPRPPKSADIDNGEQYANSSVVTSPKKKGNKDNTKQASIEEPAYGNTSDATINLRQSSPPGLQNQNGVPLYANSSDVNLSRRSAPSESIDSSDELDETQMYANSPIPIDGERLPPTYEHDVNFEGPLYADASATKNTIPPHLAVSKTNSIHYPAPDVSPPPPPQEETESNVDQDSGLTYADLDLDNGSLTIADGVSKPANRDSVMYASIA